jgi:hypothetical protein
MKDRLLEKTVSPEEIGLEVTNGIGESIAGWKDGFDWRCRRGNAASEGRKEKQKSERKRKL